MRIKLDNGPLGLWDFYAYSKKLILTCAFSIICLSVITSQKVNDESLIGDKPLWAEMMYSNNFTAAEVTDAYQNHYLNKEFVKNTYTQDYKRYIRKHTRDAFHQDKDGNINLRNNQKSYANRLNNNYRNGAANWSAIGPFDVDLNSASVGSTPGLAHIYTVEKSVSSPNTLIAGTATAGVWKSTDNGLTWNIITKNLLVTEVKAVEILSTNANTMFFGGNGYIYKSINSGISWTQTGDASFKNLFHYTYEIFSDPSNANIVYAATNRGLYKSTDTGNTWVQKESGKFWEIEIHPTNSNIVYAIKQQGNGTAFYKSSDQGVSFSNVGNGYPTVTGSEEQLRTEIAVTSAAPDKIIALATGKANGGTGTYGVYTSIDMGENWTFQCCGTGPGGIASTSNPNLMAWQTNGATNGGQYYYDVALAISQTDPDVVFSGGINIWKSNDGGSTFINHADYIYKKALQKYVHADIQDIRIYGNEIWVASDGGIFMSDDGGETFSKRMYGIVGTDFRGFGAGANEGEVLIGGTFHNGTLIKENNTYEGGWLSTLSGDNTQGNVNPHNNMITYSDIGIMTLPGNRMSIPSIKAISKKPNSSYYTGESSEYVFSPSNQNVFFVGNGGKVFKTSDNGTTFSELANFGSGKVTKIEIASSNENIIYAVYYPNYNDHKQLHKTTDGGQTWSDITPPASLFQNNQLWIAWDIAINQENPAEIWLARTPQTTSGALINGNQIFKSNNGGQNWVNISTSDLNGEYLTNIIHQKGTNGGLYIGTRRAVYYKNNEMSEWVLFQSGLPAVTYSTNLIILYNQNKIINATHRGIYASNLYETVSQEANFTSDKSIAICANETFEFQNASTGFTGNATYSWIFENGSPATSNESNPIVYFNGVGSHNVTLTISENGVTKTINKTDYITIEEDCITESNPGYAISSYENNYLIIPPLYIETNSISFSTWVKRIGNTREDAGLILMRRFAESTGLSISSTGELKYLWNQTGTGTPTGISIDREVWTHVSMTVSPTNIKIYVNGIERSFPGSYSPVNFDQDLLVGKDINAYTRYFDGYFDELCIYNQTMSIDDIRSHINLVKFSNEVPELIHYYQFNDQDAQVKDIIGGNHGSFSSYADYASSMAPIGKGVSEVKLLNGFGLHQFPIVDVEIDINSGNSCDNELGIYKIERNVSGTSDAYNSDYLFLVNHFAEDSFMINADFSIADAFTEIESNTVSNDSFKLYQLNPDAAPEWENSNVEYSKDFDPSSNNKILFSITEESMLEGKFLVGYNPIESSLAVSDIYFNLQEINPGEVDVQWFLNPEDDFLMTELQRSGDGKRFETIHTLENERGKVAFQFTDLDPHHGKNYYRLKMYYQDRSFEFSKTDHIKISKTRFADMIYPNPAYGASIVSLKNVNLEKAHISIYDMAGKKQLEIHNPEINYIDISNLVSGSYLVQIEEQYDIKQQILIKQ